MKFTSTTAEPVHIGLLSGHTAVVGTEPTELQPIFHREAIARGCLPEGVVLQQAQAPGNFDRKQVIKDAINAMLDGTDESDFTGDGKPKLTKVSARAGFQVSREEADAIHAEIEAETNPGGQGDDK